MPNPQRIIAAKKATAAKKTADKETAAAKRLAARKAASVRTVKGADIKAGMILSLYGGSETINVVKVTKNSAGAVILYGDNRKIRGVSATETCKLLGHFNP